MTTTDPAVIARQSPSAIGTHALGWRYANGRGIADVSLQVPRGAIYGFVGKNGAGKTTVIRLLLSLLRPQHGQVTLFGEPLAGNRHLLARVGALVESPSLYPHLSGRDNLAITCRLCGYPSARIDAALEQVGLRASADLAVHAYSLGMRQRLGLALALLGEPALLILDEPTNGLDPTGMADFRRLLQQLVRDTGLTVFMSSHLLADMEQVATHIGVLVDGALAFEGPLAKLRERARPTLRLRCDRPEHALALLQAQAASLADGWLRVPVASTAAARVLRTVFDAGIEVLDMALEHASLESLFLDLAATPAASPVAA